jgi:hypothetical protein
LVCLSDAAIVALSNQTPSNVTVVMEMFTPNIINEDLTGANKELARGSARTIDGDRYATKILTPSPTV